MIAATFFCVWILQAEGDQKAVQGTWTFAEYDQNGQKIPSDILKTMSVTIKGDRLTISPKLSVQYKSVIRNGKNEPEAIFSADAGKHDEVTFRLNQEKGWIDLVRQGTEAESKAIKGLYLLEGDSLTICFALSDKKRPKKMPEQPKTGLVRMILTRPAK